MSFSRSKASGGHVFLANELRVDGGNVHGDVVDKVLEVRRARHEIAFAVHFQQHADLSAGVDIAGDAAFTGSAGRLLGCRCHSLFRSSTNACSISPLASVRAFLQSIMGAPDFSRSSFTIVALITGEVPIPAKPFLNKMLFRQTCSMRARTAIPQSQFCPAGSESHWPRHLGQNSF